MTNSTDSHHGERSNGTSYQAFASAADRADVDVDGIFEGVTELGEFVIADPSQEDAWIKTQDVVEVPR